MYNADQFAEINKANVEQAAKFAALAIDNTEKLVTVNLNAAKVAFAQGVESASAAVTIKDVKEFLAFPTRYAESGVQYTIAYSRNLYDVVSAAQAQYSALAEETLAGYTKGLASWVERASQTAPVGSDAAINAMKSTVAATTAALDQFQKATKQVVSFADASVRAAADNASKATVSGANATKGRKAA